MIPRISKGGASFGDAVHYYAHDKAEQGRGLADSSNRVDWVHSLNLPIDAARGAQPEQIDAMKRCATVMQWTADHQADIKKAAGVANVGRPLKSPVYTYSLAWSPDENPTDAQMLQAAKDTLKELGLDKHQTLIVSHNDTAMKHVHCIVNRVDPDTGRAWSKSCDRLKLSKWAQAYEEGRGAILVPARAEANKQRAANKATFNRLRSPGDPDKIVRGDNLTRDERARIKAYGSKTDQQIRDERAAQQQADKDQLSDRHKRREALLNREVAQTYGGQLKAAQGALADVKARIGAKGWFRQALRKLTGHQAHDIRQANAIKKTLANIAARIGEKRQFVFDTIAHEKLRLASRHRNEVARDDAFIASRQRAKEEAEEARSLKEKGRPKRKRQAKEQGREVSPDAERTRDRSAQRRAKREVDSASATLSKQDRIARFKAARDKGKSKGKGLGD
ncbi:MAG: relaxase/mobilization nuclease domain-containing protein [Pseudomonadota bacterium]